MDRVPAIDHERASDAAETGDPTTRPDSARRRRWIVGGLVVLALLVAGFAVGIVSVRGANDQRAVQALKTGTSAYARGDFSAAETALDLAVATRSGDATAQELLGRTREARGDLNGAVEAYSAALKANPNRPDVLYRVAVIQNAKGQTDPAIASLKRALAVKPEFFPANLLLAELYTSTGARAEAVAELDIVIAARPAGVDVNRLQERRDALR